MRALAITLVLLHHFLELVPIHSPWLFNFYGWGFIGVDIFFALSGFLIGRILLKLDSMVVRPRELLRFWTRRWLRTLPIYYVMLLVRAFMAIAIILYLHLDWKLLHAVPAYFVFMQSWAWQIPPFFTETWSLAVEEWFYLLFPVLWVVIIRGGVRPFRAFVFASIFILLASTIMRLGATSYIPQNWLNHIYPVTIYRFDSIAFGLLGAALSVTCPRLWTRLRWPGLVVGLGLLWLDRHLTILDFLHKERGYVTIWHCSVTGMGSALLLPWCSSVEKLFWRPLQNLVGIISRWSYSLYLTHGMFITLAWDLFGSQIKVSAIWAWMLLIMLSCCSFALAGFLHYWIEKPGMNLRERWKLSRQIQGGRI